MEPYFFQKGIHFECTDCGYCCTGEPGVVFISDQEITALAAWLQQDEDAVRTEYVRSYEDQSCLREEPNGDCCFFDGRCRIYPVRPHQCRTYPFWLQNLRSPEAWARTCAECPGIGRGRWYSPEEIITRVQEDMA